MQGSQSLCGALRRRLKEERGWALIDALASAVVVVLAFVGTTMAFNGSTASVVRDQKKTQALIVAQNELNEMRGIGQRQISDLLDLNDTTTSVTYKGVTYNVAFDAYYVTGLGSDQQDACEVAYSSGGGTARYIYMRVKVTYAGQGSGGGSNQYLSSPASLDSYYSPEGGAVQADTGTLRVYILNRLNQVAGVSSAVNLYKVGNSTAVDSQVPNATTGCVLFTGLVRDTYQVQVTAGSKQDLYMTNPGSSTVTLPVVMPDRGALSREIRIESPVTVTPRIWVNRGTTAARDEVQITYASSGTGATNAFFSANANPYWIGASSDIRVAPNADFSYTPSGIVFMPHVNTATAGSLPNAMFPTAQGYAAYAGPCDANDPNAGAADTVNNFKQVPASLPDATWVPGGTNLPKLLLSQIRATATLNGQPRPTAIVRNTNYYWGQVVSTTGATVWVKLKSDAEGGTLQPRCRTNFTRFNQWVQLPGKITASGTFLPDAAESLPVGRYDVCVKVPYTYQYAKSTDVTATTLANPGSTSADNWLYYAASDQSLLYDSYINLNNTWSWPSNTSPTPSTSAGTDCTA